MKDELAKNDLLQCGDMPGDKIRIDDSHIYRAEIIFPHLESYLRSRHPAKTIVSIFGGSGVGKSEIGSLLAQHCRRAGFIPYLLSGDNYPFRYPALNDSERLNRFRYSGWASLINHENFNAELSNELTQLIAKEMDADTEAEKNNLGIQAYQSAGRKALCEYLGSHEELDFGILNNIITLFKNSEKKIPLKRMGRAPGETWFDVVDFSETPVMIIEWTHGNSPHLQGVDFPIFLYSSPEETSEHRRIRGRDTHTDSPFTRLILDIEQSMVNRQSQNARIIINKAGTLISHDQITKNQL